MVLNTKNIAVLTIKIKVLGSGKERFSWRVPFG